MKHITSTNNQSWPGLSRPSTSLLGQKFVDARHKAGHDEAVVGGFPSYDDSACDSASML